MQHARRDRARHRIERCGKRPRLSRPLLPVSRSLSGPPRSSAAVELQFDGGQTKALPKLNQADFYRVRRRKFEGRRVNEATDRLRRGGRNVVGDHGVESTTVVVTEVIAHVVPVGAPYPG